MNRVTMDPQIFVIAHGKTERIFAETIRSQLRIPIKVIANNNGNNNIEITSFADYVKKRRDLKTEKAFSEEYTLKIDRETKVINGLSIFPIMDLEKGYPQADKKAYQEGTLFKQLWMAKYIIPIYNDDCIETVLKSVGLPYAENTRDKRNYSRYFSDMFSEGHPIAVIESLCDKFSKCPKTNMECFLQKCLERQREMTV